MTIKSFNVEEETYQQFHNFCQEHGMSMSKQIQMFMESVVSNDPHVKEAYLKKLKRLQKGEFVRVKSFEDRYGL